MVSGESRRTPSISPPLSPPSADTPFPAGAEPKAPPGTDWNTAWVWIIVALPLLPMLLLLFVDSDANPQTGDPTELGADYVMDTAGTQESINEAVAMVNRGGKVCLAAFAHDSVVPVDRLDAFMTFCDDEFARRGLDVASWGHVSDGNLHPNISFDHRDRDLAERVHRACREIMAVCVAAGEVGTAGATSEVLEYSKRPPRTRCRTRPAGAEARG